MPHDAQPESEQAVNREELSHILDFLRAAESLKSTHRSAWTAAGERENAAAHTWRLCLFALVVHDRFPGVDLARLLSICIVRDLGEAVGGDIPAPVQAARPEGKGGDERRDLVQLADVLPTAARDRVIALWDEYEGAATPEARLAKGLDKLETILQHTQGANPPDFDYRFNLDYGRRYTEGDPVLVALRAMLDDATEQRAREEETG